MIDFDGIYRGKKVLVTGHTGFKGSWLSIWLHELGARVIGFSLSNWDNNYIFEKVKLGEKIIDERGDIRDINKLRSVFEKHEPEMVFHLAAQPLVRDSYNTPLETFDVNIMGTANVLECVRNSSVRAAVMITTDKCYKNHESEKGYVEEDELGGHDPYSASKACAELVIKSYRDSFFSHDMKKLVASARAGNVLGGGDFAKDRLMTDCITALKDDKVIEIRNPSYVRPWQHVLEPLSGYLLLGQRLLEGKEIFASAWNFGPDNESVISVGEVADMIVERWGGGKWLSPNEFADQKLHETKLLYLDNSKAKKLLEWFPSHDIAQTIKLTIDWYKLANEQNEYKLCVDQIRDHILKVKNGE